MVSSPAPLYTSTCLGGYKIGKLPLQLPIGKFEFRLHCSGGCGSAHYEWDSFGFVLRSRGGPIQSNMFALMRGDPRVNAI